jgi:alkylation response protein AidB-like acyl-CoA dehydrogenase
MNFDLKEEQKEFQRNLRKVCEELLRPKAREVDRDGMVPEENLLELAKAGYMGLTIPPELGGCGMDMVSFLVGTEEVARCCPSTALVASTSLMRFGLPTMLYGSDGTKRRLIPLLAEGKLRGAWAHTEKEGGSDRQNLKTVAVPYEDGFSLSGQKHYVLNGPEAQALLVVAAIGGQEGKKGVFLLELPCSGVECGPEIRTVGARGARVSSIYLKDCLVSRERLLGGEEGPSGEEIERLPQMPLVLAGYSIGVGQAALELAISYAMGRTTFGRPIVTYQEVHFKIADMFVNVDVARQLALRAAWLIDSGKGSHVESSVAKLFASEAAESCALLCAHIHGGASLEEGSDVDRILRDSRMARVLCGTSEMHRMLIAEEVLAGRA